MKIKQILLAVFLIFLAIPSAFSQPMVKEKILISSEYPSIFAPLGDRFYITIDPNGDGTFFTLERSSIFPGTIAAVSAKNTIYTGDEYTISYAVRGSGSDVAYTHQHRISLYENGELLGQETMELDRNENRLSRFVIYPSFGNHQYLVKEEIEYTYCSRHCTAVWANADVRAVDLAVVTRPVVTPTKTATPVPTSLKLTAPYTFTFNVVPVDITVSTIGTTSVGSPHSFELYPGTYSWTVSKTGYVPQSGSFTRTASSLQEYKTIVLVPTGATPTPGITLTPTPGDCPEGYSKTTTGVCVPQQSSNTTAYVIIAAIIIAAVLYLRGKK